MSESLETITAGIRSAHRRRVYAMEQRKRADLALLSFLRSQLGWRRDLPEAERDAISETAKTIASLGEKEVATNRKIAKATEAGKKTPEPFATDSAAYHEWRDMILATIAGREAFDKIEDVTTQAMEELARKLPVYPWFAENVFATQAKSLAVIVGDAGDLAIYSNPAKLWKRMGVGVIEGVRQGGLSKTAAKEAWIEHGYNRMRRSRMWNIGDALIKNAGGKYREVYLARKEYERTKAEALGLIVAPTAKIPKDKTKAAGYRSDGHIHRRAQRFMEKALLKDLWQAWRRSVHHSGDTLTVTDQGAATPSGELQQAIAVSSPNGYAPAARRRASPATAPEKWSPGATNSDRQTISPAPPSVSASAARRAIEPASSTRQSPAGNPLGQTIEDVPTTLAPSARRRATLVSQPNVPVPAASSDQQANAFAVPNVHVPAGRQPIVDQSPIGNAAGATNSRVAR